MTPWQEVDSEIFSRIFDHYWKNSPNSILEIQNITSLKRKDHDTRAFIGKSCDPIEWIDWNKESLEKLVPLEMRDDFLKKSKLGFCLLEGGPRVAPFGSSPSHYEILLGNVFGVPGLQQQNNREQKTSLVFWYTSPDGTRKWRVRSWDENTWRRAVYDYLNAGYVFPEKYKKDDLEFS